MKVKIFLLTFALCAVKVLGNCKSSKCPATPVHYKELGCTPIKNDGECCPRSFDCKHLDTRDASKCYYNGKTYNEGDKIDDEDSLRKSCVPIANCGTGGRIIYYILYSSCCAINTVCGDRFHNLATCEFEGETYQEGQKMYPAKYKCYTCYCTKDFDNKSITKNKNCVKISCDFDLKSADKIRNKCAPVYSQGSCCPFNWVCPEDGDSVKKGGKDNGDSSPKCKFGKLEFEIGDILLTAEKKCSKCTCNIPPWLDCVYEPGC